MSAPLILLIASVVGVFVAWSADSAELLLITGPAMLASLWLMLKALFKGLEGRMGQRDASEPKAKTKDRRIAPRRNRRGTKLLVVDGSNVMHWKDNTAQLSTLLDVLRALEARGYAPGVVFDANAGYKISGSYAHDFAFGKLLGLPVDRVMVVHKGEPADPVILAAASEHKVRVVSNDRFRDWADDFPEVADPAHFMRGGYADGVLWLQD